MLSMHLTIHTVGGGRWHGLTAAVEGGSGARGSGRDGSGGVWGETARISLRGARGGAVTGGITPAWARCGGRRRAAAVGSFLLHLRGANEAEGVPCADSGRSKSASLAGAV
jgi:hypothetical protein